MLQREECRKIIRQFVVLKTLGMGTSIGNLPYIRVMFPEFWANKTKKLNQENKSILKHHTDRGYRKYIFY